MTEFTQLLSFQSLSSHSFSLNFQLLHPLHTTWDHTSLHLSKNFRNPCHDGCWFYAITTIFLLACSILIFYNICSLVHTKTLLNKWERVISEHAFPTPWAVTASSRFSFPLSKHTGQFLLILALRQTSSKQIIKPKPFPSPMISPPLDQPTESTPPAATQVTGWCSTGSWTLPSQRRQWGALPGSEHHHQQQSSAVTQDLPSNEANCRPCWAPARIPTLLLEEPLPACSSVGLSRHQDPKCPLAPTHSCQGRSSPADQQCLGHTQHLWQHRLSSSAPAQAQLSPQSSSLLLFHTHFLHFHYTAQYLQSHPPLSTPQPAESIWGPPEPEGGSRETAKNMEHRPPEAMHTLVSTKQNLFSQFSAMKAKS